MNFGRWNLLFQHYLYTLNYSFAVQHQAVNIEGKWQN